MAFGRARTKSTAQSSGMSAHVSVSPPDTWVDVDISTSDYARRRRELMEMMTDLRFMGWVLVDLVAHIAHTTSYSAETLIDLPAVVVIGGQSGLCSPSLAVRARLNCMFQRGKAHSSRPSAGYVSNIQSFCLFLIMIKINVPRDSGTCTR
jgi:hypothetical protein